MDGERDLITSILECHQQSLEDKHCVALKIPRSTSATSNAVDAGNIHKDLKSLCVLVQKEFQKSFGTENGVSLCV